MLYAGPQNHCAAKARACMCDPDQTNIMNPPGCCWKRIKGRHVGGEERYRSYM